MQLAPGCSFGEGKAMSGGSKLHELRGELEALAQAQGFATLGIAQAVKPPHASHFREWLRLGFSADMHWMERTAEKRCDPQLVLPGARSIVMLAMNYWQGADAPGAGKIARYALGDDYHELMLQRLAPLARRLEEAGGQVKCYVDTGPVLEREFARLAGIGWQGKSTMLLDRRLGTWFFLAAILTSLELEPDQPASAHCGRCTRCMDACPTTAIVAPWHLDARRCLSYLTIENKGPIPVEFRRALGGRIYGCDECLEVCPWNRFAEISREAAFQARDVCALPLRDYLEWDDTQFRQAFRRSPIKRIGRARFLRNVCVALGNTGDAEDLPSLHQAAQDPSPLIAEHAAWAVEEIKSRQAAVVDIASEGPAAFSSSSPSSTESVVINSATPLS